MGAVCPPVKAGHGNVQRRGVIKLQPRFRGLQCHCQPGFALQNRANCRFGRRLVPEAEIVIIERYRPCRIADRAHIDERARKPWEFE